ncbi:ECF-type sigma factor [Rheinheimera pleomorphica]|uniref:ECF-type sigma factor n=1 Tax=Rheinheimera pleomorphica TaxID=2703963 RepID=UPI0014225492|nr:ECF-type sigma factor [Rheinheimera pleomorphica]
MSTLSQPSDITVLLSRWQSGDEEAQTRLSQLVYDKLHQLAAQCMYRERHNHTLQPTALVNEAFISLSGANVSYQDQLHFFNLAGRIMRRILVDHARARQAAKRGDGYAQLTLTDSIGHSAGPEGIIAIDQAISNLADIDPAKAEILELQFFAGLTTLQIARLYGVSSKTIERSSKLAKAFLHQAL